MLPRWLSGMSPDTCPLSFLPPQVECVCVGGRVMNYESILRITYKIEVRQVKHGDEQIQA